MDDTNELLYKLKKTDDDINQLLQAHKNLVHYVLARLGCLNNHDYESAAFQGLWNAVQTFDIFGSTAFSTYAYSCIRNAINDVRRKDMRRNNTEQIVDFTVTTTDYVFPVYDCAVNVEDEEAAERILTLTQEYISGMRQDTIACRIIKAWYAYRFDISETNLAKLCNTSSTNVSRAQAMFRAWLSGKLKGQPLLL